MENNNPNSITKEKFHSITEEDINLYKETKESKKLIDISILPTITLFMLQSVDGKISTGRTEKLDFDIDLKRIDGVKEGLDQYYEIETTTDTFSLITGKTISKALKASRTDLCLSNLTEDKIIKNLTYVVFDNHWLNYDIIRYLATKAEKGLIIFTSNDNHPGYSVAEEDNFLKRVHIEDISSDSSSEKSTLKYQMSKLRKKYGCERITLQGGAKFNKSFIEEKLVDHIDIVVAPIIIGGKDTPTLVDGLNNSTFEDFKNTCAVLKLINIEVLENNYIRLRYDVIK